MYEEMRAETDAGEREQDQIVKLGRMIRDQAVARDFRKQEYCTLAE